MSQLPRIDVGMNIRIIRETKGYSLRKLAALSGLSPNAISLTERGINSPTVSSLHRLALALEVPITDFFKDKGKKVAVLARKDQGLRFYSHGLEMESLGSGISQQQLEPFRVKIFPQAGNLDDPISHAGQEFVHCLEGEIEYWVGNQQYRLQTGDSLLFDATEAHKWHNPTQIPVTLLLILQTSHDLHIARRRHLGSEHPPSVPR